KGIRIGDSKDPELFMKNYHYQWIADIIGNSDLKKLLNQLKENRNISDYYTEVSYLGFIDFPHDKGRKDFNVVTSSHRLLLLFKFWNVIQYWYANKFLITNNWEGILDKYIPEFLSCENAFEFELLKSRLFTELKDSHTTFNSRIVYDSLFKYKPNFRVTNVNDSLVVNFITNQKKCKKDDIQLGDVITEINGMSVKETLNQQLLPLIPVSNSSNLPYYSFYLLCNSKSEIDVSMIREGELHKRRIHLSEEPVLDNPKTKEGKHSPIEKLRKDVFYLDLSGLTNKACDSFFKVNENNIENLVIDLRQNVNPKLGIKHLGNYLVNQKKNFVNVLHPVGNTPSKFEFIERSEGLIGVFSDAFTVGKKSNKKYVKGKIILLVNRKTQSI